MNITTIFLASTVLTAVVILIGYLLASAESERWLTMREWWTRLTCSHKTGRLLGIEFDGVSILECNVCKKLIRVPPKW